MSPSAPVQPADIVRRVGDTNERALRYALSPDPKLARLSRKAHEQLIPDLPPVTAGALLGPAALARHFVASAASGRYRDLFPLWELFRQRPDDCRPILAEREQALSKGRDALRRAARLGLRGRADRLAEDIHQAHGLIWQWLRETVIEDLTQVGARPAVASALLAREPELNIPLPAEPDEDWLDEAAAARSQRPLAPAVDAVLAANVDRLPASVSTLAMAHEHYPDKVGPLLERVDLDSPAIGAVLAWARDHGGAELLRARICALVEQAAGADRARGLAAWHAWRERGVDVPLPDTARAHGVDGLDLGRPETAAFMALLRNEGAGPEPQSILDGAAAANRQLGEKAYEAFVCAGLDVFLPPVLHDNPSVKDGTRCEHCGAWTWVRPGHERRCPRRSASAASAGAPDPA
ncbi:MAG TPA: hypothetical protein VML96_09830 [Egibacteraceae bacterium]|nr:hypothetical protein [Egibacteraceae bacterium]